MTYMYACMNVCMYVYVCVCMHICIHACMYACMHECIQLNNSETIPLKLKFSIDLFSRWESHHVAQYSDLSHSKDPQIQNVRHRPEFEFVR